MSRPAAPETRHLDGDWSEAPRLVETRPAHRTAATHDLTTGLAHQATLVTCIANALTASEGTTALVGVVACRLDGIDRIAAEHGGLVRDEVLVEAAARIRRVVGGDDAPARISDDTLVAVAIRSSAFEVEAAATAISRSVRAPIPTSAGAVGVVPTATSTVAPRRVSPVDTLARFVGAAAARHDLVPAPA